MEEKELLPIKDLTPTEALETLGEFPIWLPDRERFIKIKNSHEYKLIEKALKALEIIKKYFTLENILDLLPKETYDAHKEEFDLLREVLKD